MSAKRIVYSTTVALITAAAVAFANPSATAQTGAVRVAVTSKSLIFAPVFVARRPQDGK